MQYAHVLSLFYGNPLAIEPAKFQILSRLFAGFARGERPPATDVAAATSQKRSGAYAVVGRIAVIPIFGTIAQRLSAVEQASGGISTEAIGNQIDAAVADPGVRKILLQIDSPGGSVYGVQELAAKIREAKASKRVVAIADPVAASAAYWLAAQADEVFVTPSGMAGSIGVIMEHCDESAADEKTGVKTTLITAGEYKGETHPSSPLGEEARANLQAIVDGYYDAFVKDVAKGRGVTEDRVRSSFGKGRMMLANQAKTAGLVDGVRTLDSTLKYMGAADGTSRNATASAGLSRDAIAARLRCVEISEAADCP
jgi:capsid assembly protease